MTEITEAAYKQSVADRIRQARTAKGLSQGTLARTIGKRRTHVNEWENARGTPRWPNLQLLARALDVSTEWLLTGQGDGPRRTRGR